MHFSKKSSRQSLASPEILAFASHCWANFQPILNFFIPNFKLQYEDSENIKKDCVNTVIFNLHRIKRRAFFSGTLGTFYNTITVEVISKSTRDLQSYRSLNIQNIARVKFKQQSFNVVQEKLNLANVRNNSM